MGSSFGKVGSHSTKVAPCGTKVGFQKVCRNMPKWGQAFEKLADVTPKLHHVASKFVLKKFVETNPNGVQLLKGWLI